MVELQCKCACHNDRIWWWFPTSGPLDTVTPSPAQSRNRTCGTERRSDIPGLGGETTMDTDNDIRFMREALRVATQDGADPALSPIGCVIVMAGGILPAERNHVAEPDPGQAAPSFRPSRSAYS